MKKLMYATLLVLFIVLAGCSGKSDQNSTPKETTSSEKPSSDQKELTISAAVSLTDALEEMQKTFEKEHQVTLKFNLGSSGILAQQIEQGAPADIFISANEDWMDKLEEKKLILEGTRKNITENRIVLVTSKDHPANVNKIADIKADNAGQIAIGNPESVPAGKYTKEVLEHLKKWDELEKSFIMAKDVRQVLTYTETGNANLGFVYASDAEVSDKVTVLDTADVSLHDPIIYPGAVVADTKNKETAKAFMDYLESDKGQEILKKYGFGK